MKTYCIIGYYLDLQKVLKKIISYITRRNGLYLYIYTNKFYYIMRFRLPVEITNDHMHCHTHCFFKVYNVKIYLSSLPWNALLTRRNSCLYLMSVQFWSVLRGWRGLTADNKGRQPLKRKCQWVFVSVRIYYITWDFFWKNSEEQILIWTTSNT